MRKTNKEGNASSRLTHEVLRQSLPSKTFQSPSKLSRSRASKWVLHSDLKNAPSVSHEALNPLRAYVSLSRVTFGPKSLLPNTDSSVLVSTANELHRGKYTPVNPKKLKAAAVGLSQSSATLMVGLAASKLELHNLACKEHREIAICNLWQQI
ncbi:unnamed protein product [Camellia sinensis]